MPAPQVGQIENTVRGLTVGMIRALDSAKAQRALEGLAERVEQFQIEVFGQAEEFASWSFAKVKFETVFVDGRGQRDSELLRPHFTYGAYIPVGGPVDLSACVTEWEVNDRQETIGCTLAIGTAASDVARKFRGELHAEFSGYGAPVLDYGDIGLSDEN